MAEISSTSYYYTMQGQLAHVQMAEQGLKSFLDYPPTGMDVPPAFKVAWETPAPAKVPDRLAQVDSAGSVQHAAVEQALAPKPVPTIDIRKPAEPGHKVARRGGSEARPAIKPSRLEHLRSKHPHAAKRIEAQVRSNHGVSRAAQKTAGLTGYDSTVRASFCLGQGLQAWEVQECKVQGFKTNTGRPTPVIMAFFSRTGQPADRVNAHFG